MVNEYPINGHNSHSRLEVAIVQQLILLSEQYKTLNELMENKKNYLREQMLLAKERRHMHQKKARFLIAALMLRTSGAGQSYPNEV